jgi:hypothetical protein
MTKLFLSLTIFTLLSLSIFLLHDGVRADGCEDSVPVTYPVCGKCIPDYTPPPPPSYGSQSDFSGNTVDQTIKNTVDQSNSGFGNTNIRGSVKINNNQAAKLQNGQAPSYGGYYPPYYPPSSPSTDFTDNKFKQKISNEVNQKNKGAFNTNKEGNVAITNNQKISASNTPKCETGACP